MIINTIESLRPKILIVCFSGTIRITCNPQHQKFLLPYIYSIYIEQSSTHHEYQFNLAAICLVYVMVGWLVEFCCTHSHDLAPLIKIFLETLSEHHF